MKIEAIAAINVEKLLENTYPGRGIVLGVNAAGTHLVQVYWIMGRKLNSRNRVMTEKNGQVSTELADPSKVPDPKQQQLTIYTAMAESNGYYIVSNGHQTMPVLDELSHNDFAGALLNWDYEPDGPIFTSRISGLTLCFGQGEKEKSHLKLSVIRKSAFGNICDRLNFSYPKIPGYGYCITTYAGDGDPPAPFAGEPLLLPIPGNDIGQVLAFFWDCLNPENRVSLAVKFIDRETGVSRTSIENKYPKVS